MMRLWQSIDEDSGKIGAIPASPFLLPALVLILLAPFIELLLGWIGHMAAPKIPLTDEEYEESKQRFHWLEHKLKTSMLTSDELQEYKRLLHPKWSDSIYPFDWN